MSMSRILPFVVCGIGMALAIIGLCTTAWLLFWAGLICVAMAIIIPTIVTMFGMLCDPLGDGFWRYTLPNALCAALIVAAFIPYYTVWLVWDNLHDLFVNKLCKADS